MAKLGTTEVLGNLTVSLKTKTDELEVKKSITCSGNIVRLSHSSGYLVGSYDSVGANDIKTNPIYTIGSNYQPSDISLGNMYGIGFSHSNFWGSGKSSGWGLYVVEGGAIHTTISSGGIWNSGSITSNGLINANGGLSQDGQVILNGSDTWLRTYGSTGLYNETYGGGIYMIDSSWVRAYQDKGFYTAGEIRGGSFSNDQGKLGSNAANAKNHFTQYNAGSASMTTGWVSAAFGDTSGARTVIGQASGKAVICAHSPNLDAWANLHLNTDSGNVVVGLPCANADVRPEKFQVFGSAWFGSSIEVNSISYPVSTGTNPRTLLQAQMADSDFFRILVGGTGSNSGFVELATADDGTEPIYVRQYTGVFTSLTRSATLLDANGNTSFPGAVTAGWLGVSNSSGTGAGISLHNGAVSGVPNYGLTFAKTTTCGTHGAVTGDWATYFTVDGATNRGWVFKNGITSSGNVASISASGTASFNGDVTAFASDERLKTEFVKIENSLELTKQLDTGYYYFNELAAGFGFDSSKRQVGVKAGQLEKLLPEVVAPAPFDSGKDGSVTGENYLTVKYEKLTALLIQNIKDLTAEVEKLKNNK